MPISRVNESEIGAGGDVATEDVYMPARDGNGRLVGYGETLVARKGQRISPAMRADMDAAAAEGATVGDTSALTEAAAAASVDRQAGTTETPDDEFPLGSDAAKGTTSRKGSK